MGTGAPVSGEGAVDCYCLGALYPGHPCHCLSSNLSMDCLSLSRLTRTNRITELLRLRELIALDKDRTHACFFLPLRWRALESQAAVLLCEAAAGKREDFTQIGAKWVHPHFPPALPCAVLWRAGRAGWHGGWPQHYRAWTATAGRTVRGTRYCRYSTYPP